MQYLSGDYCAEQTETKFKPFTAVFHIKANVTIAIFIAIFNVNPAQNYVRLGAIPAMRQQVLTAITDELFPLPCPQFGAQCI
jgi:hypothetical protein